jgi:predicted ester cyclase
MDINMQMMDFVEALNQMNMDRMAQFLSDELEFHGPAPQALSKAQFLGMFQILQTAFPDIKVNGIIVSCEGNQARITSAIEGTHKGILDMTAFGGSVIPATGKTFKLPVGLFDYTWDEEQIVTIQAQANPEGGFAGIMQQLGLVKS